MLSELKIASICVVNSVEEVASILADQIAGKNSRAHYKRWYRQGAVRHAEAIDLAIGSIAALYAWVRIQFPDTQPQPIQFCLPAASQPVALLAPALEEKFEPRVLITPPTEPTPIEAERSPIYPEFDATDFSKPTPASLQNLNSLSVRELRSLAKQSNLPNWGRIIKQEGKAGLLTALTAHLA